MDAVDRELRVALGEVCDNMDCKAYPTESAAMDALNEARKS